jgi:hypothetical protein
MLGFMAELLLQTSAAGLKILPSKCDFFATQTHYLGFTISSHGISLMGDMTDILLSWPAPTMQKDQASMLGKIQYYNGSLPHYSRLSALLHEAKSRSSTNWCLSEAELDAFFAIKQLLLTSPVFSVSTAQNV